MKKQEVRDKYNNQLIFKTNKKGLLYFRRQDKSQVLMTWDEVLSLIPLNIIEKYLDN